MAKREPFKHISQCISSNPLHHSKDPGLVGGGAPVRPRVAGGGERGNWNLSTARTGLGGGRGLWVPIIQPGARDKREDRLIELNVNMLELIDRNMA
jgi:hypothetical protein